MNSPSSNCLSNEQNNRARNLVSLLIYNSVLYYFGDYEFWNLGWLIKHQSPFYMIFQKFLNSKINTLEIIIFLARTLRQIPLGCYNILHCSNDTITKSLKG